VQERLKKLRDNFLHRKDGKAVDAVLIVKPQNRHYLSGFRGTTAMLLITSEKAFLITDFRYIEQAQEQAPSFEVVKMNQANLETLVQLVKEHKISRLGLEGDFLTYQQYQELGGLLKGVEMVSIAGMLEELRVIKTPEEIELIRKAVEITDQAFTHILGYLKPGITESEVALELEYQMKKSGAERLSFDSIIASGPRSSLPHGVASSRVLQWGDLVKMDFGCIYQGYCSDMTRTVILGEANSKQKEIYQIVLEAQLASLDALSPGKTGREMDSIARRIITEKGYGDNFGHGLGHGVGLEIHEKPALAFRDETILQPGMAVTIEPGIYLPGWGGVRIEDLAIVTPEGKEILTKSTKDLIILT